MPDQAPGSFLGPSNFVDLLRHRAAVRPNDTAFTYLVDGENDEQHLTYGELDRQARAIAAWLLSMGMEGRHALLLYPPGLEFITAYFGCMYARVVAAPMSSALRQRSLTRVQTIAADSGAAVALTTGTTLVRIEPTLEKTPGLANLTWLASDQSPADIERQWVQPAIRADTPAMIQYTSGSTGSPKGVVLTHGNLMHNSALICHCFEHTRSSRGVCWLPTYHDMGLVGGVLQPIYVGQPSVVMSPMAFLQKPVRWLDAITKYRATSSGGPNFAYDLCIRKVTPEQRAKLDLSTWSVASNGAEPIRASTLDQFVEMFGPCGFRREAFYPCYGLAEATVMLTGGLKSQLPVVRAFDAKALEGHQVQPALPDEEGARLLVGCGECLPDQKLVIVDPVTRIRVAGDRVGEIWAAGPSIGHEYWRRPDETRYTFRAHLADTGEGPFLRTGDLGFMQNGELFVTGRLHDLIIVRGRNHYPQDIELTAGQSHEWFRPDCTAAFTIEVDGTERLVVVQEAETQKHRDYAGAIAALRREVLEEHDLVVESVSLIKSGGIPRTSSGKVQRLGCREDYLRGSLPELTRWCAWEQGGSVPPARESRGESEATGGQLENVPVPFLIDRAKVEQTVLAEVRRAVPQARDSVTMGTRFTDLGLDSLQRLDLVVTIEKAVGRRFPHDELAHLATLKDVADAAERLLRQPDAAPAEVVHPGDYQFDRLPEYLRLQQELTRLRAMGLGEIFHQPQQSRGSRTTINGRELVQFSSYNYLGLADDPAVIAAAKDALDRYGSSVSASRVVAGERALHRDLEAAIARFLGAAAAVTFVGGHATNETTLGHLLGPGDLILHDALAHNSIIQGAVLSGAHRRPFPHNNLDALGAMLADLRHTYRRVIIVVEGIYSMDGDIPDLRRLIDLKRTHKAWLMVDEAHSLGVLGQTGRGIGEHFNVSAADVDLWMGTLSKSLGSCGGYIAGSAELVEYLRYTAPGFVYSVGISPPNAAAALEAIRRIEAEPQRVARLAQRADLFRALAIKRGLSIGAARTGAIVPILIGDAERCIRASLRLTELGVSVMPIVPPAVSEHAARLRFFITAHHNEADIRLAIDALSDALNIPTRREQPAATL